MKTRKIFVFIAVVFAVLAMANFAFAINRVEVKTTSEGVQYHSTCDKGGGFSLQFDEGSVLTHADQITIDLPFSPPSSQATLCRDIDLVIAPVGTWIYYSATGAWSTGVAPPAAPNNLGWIDALVPAANSPVISSTGPGSLTDGGSGVFFHIYGTSGQSSITIDVIGADWLDADADLIPDTTSNSGSLTVGVGETLTLYFLDQQTNAVNFSGVGGQDGIWTDTSTANTYANIATLTNNTLCINVFNWEAATVNVHMDSKLDKFTFIPTDPPIAHIMGGEVTPYVCKGESCSNISRGTTQAGQSCTFDNDIGGTTGGYCENAPAHKLILQSTTAIDNNDLYYIDARILVNGLYGNYGVYFSNQAVTIGSYSSSLDACNAAITYTFTGANAYYGTGTTPVAPMTNTCAIADTARATRLVTPQEAIITGTTHQYLYINLPALNYDFSMIDDNDIVTVRYIIRKVPCGVVYSGTHCIGTFGCLTGQTTALLYPYFTPMNDDPANDDYWDGIVISNLSSTAGTADLTIYEQDGDVGTMTTSSIAGNSMYVNLLWSMYGGMTKTAGSGTLGDSRCYIVVCTGFKAHGFAMVGNQATGESMGYLPVIEDTELCP
ncbi:MAG: hypothetical protein GY749_34140 [Desulfobacteraceae bacterium]|nr:hypothetical protein [Desulfobacteraceae bacterium]